MNSILFYAIITLVTVPLTILACSFVEYLVHGPFMHGRFATENQKRIHEDHHRFYPGEKFANHDHGENVFLPWWAAVSVISPTSLIGIAISWLTGIWLIAVLVFLTSAIHYFTYMVIHTYMHVPKEGRFELWVKKTKWYKKLWRYHQAHHAPGVSFDKPIYLCIVCHWADHIIQFVRRQLYYLQG
jgi:hypothetical protein